MTDLLLRPATLDDVELLDRWNDAPHVTVNRGADDPIDWAAELTDPLPWKEHLVAELDGAPIGVMEILDPHWDEDRYWGDMPPGYRALDIWIGEASCLGQGHGTRMMERALARCFEDPSVWCVLVDPLTSNTAVHRFYERLGFKRVEQRRFGEDDCYVYQLVRRAWELASGR